MDKPAVETPGSLYRLSRDGSFRLFWISRVLSGFAFQGSAIAVGWLIYDKTGSAYDLGLVGLFQFLPMVVLTFVVGHVADRFDRRRIVNLCQAAELVVMTTLAVGIFEDWLSVPMIFAAVAAIGAAQSFERPTTAAILPGIVPPSALGQAVALSSSMIQTAMILGPSVGGLLYGIAPTVPFAAAAAMFAVSAVCMALIRLRTVPQTRAPMTLEAVFAGVSFIRRRPVILGTISLDLFAVLLGGATALLPIFAKDILHAGPWGLGLLRSAPAVGALAMSIVLARFPLGRGVGRKMFVSVAIFGLGTLVFALSTSLALSVAALAILGAADNVSVVIRSSLVQLLTPDDMRGRVNAVNSLFIGTSNQLGEFESGMTAGLFGPVAACLIGGVGTLLVVLLWMRLFPDLKRVETLSG
jgi:MFS family permease